MKTQIYTTKKSPENNSHEGTQVSGKKPGLFKKLFYAGALLAGICMSSVAGAYTVSGTVFLAPNGLPLKDSNGDITGTPQATVYGQPLYVYIINQSANIIARAQVASNGTYSIPNLVDGQASAAQLSSNYYELNGPVFFLGLPSLYYPVGEGDLPSGDLTPDYSFPLAQTSNIQVNFAFEARPNSTNAIISTYNFNSYHRLIVPASTFNGADPEDGAYTSNLAGRSIDFYPATPAASTQIYYYDTLLNFATAGSKITIDTFNPNQVSLAYTGMATTRSFSYTVVDNAGARPFVPTIVSSTAPLMINLASFTGLLKGETAMLKWTTASEKNNDYFVIERSTDGSHFSSIDKVASQAKDGNSDVLLSYTYSDNLALVDQQHGAYYRLRSVETNGTSTLSRVVYIRTDKTNTGAAAQWNVYPNPANDYLTIAAANTNNSPSTITLTSTTGAILLSKTISGDPGAQATLPMINLPNGQYFLQVSSDNGTSFQQQVTVLR